MVVWKLSFKFLLKRWNLNPIIGWHTWFCLRYLSEHPLCCSDAMVETLLWQREATVDTKNTKKFSACICVSTPALTDSYSCVFQVSDPSARLAWNAIVRVIECSYATSYSTRNLSGPSARSHTYTCVHRCVHTDSYTVHLHTVNMP